LNHISTSLVPSPFPPPVFDRLPYANTEGEGLGDLVTWRCPTVIIPVSCRTVPGTMNNGWYWHCLANALASSPQTDSTSERASRFFVGHHPPCVYLLSTWRNRMWPNLPGLPPPYLHTVSHQILEVGTSWERGYYFHFMGGLKLLASHKC